MVVLNINTEYEVYFLNILGILDSSWLKQQLSFEVVAKY